MYTFGFNSMTMCLCMGWCSAHLESAFCLGMSVIVAGVAAGFAGSVVSTCSPAPPSVQSECDSVL